MIVFLVAMLIGIAIGLWLGIAHGAQFEALFTRLRRKPRMNPDTAKGALFQTRIPVVVDPECPPDRIYLTDRYKAEKAKRIVVLKLDELSNTDERT